MSTAVEAALQEFDPSALEKTARPLADGLQATRALIDQVKSSDLPKEVRDQVLFLLARKEEQFERALQRALGLYVEARVAPAELAPGRDVRDSVATFNHAIPGQAFSVDIRLLNRSGLEITPTAVDVRVPSGWSVRPEALELKPLP